MTMRSLLPLAAVFFGACGGEGTTAPLVARAYRMTGEAMAHTDAGLTARCRLDLVFMLDEGVSQGAGFTEYAGSHTGEIQRAITEADGSGIGLSVLVVGEIALRRYDSGRMEILIPLNATAETPFYRELARWEGEPRQGQEYAGRWRCAPLLVEYGGYVDRDITLEGTWSLTPE